MSVKTFKEYVIEYERKMGMAVDEEAHVNSIGAPPGNIAGVSDGEPVVSKKRQAKLVRRNMNEDSFANTKVFEVDDTTFYNCRLGKKRYDRWDKTVDMTSECGVNIKEYARKNSGKAIILRNSSDGTMIYLKREHYE